MPMTPYHASLIDDLNHFWKTGALAEDGELNALAKRSHGGDVMQAALHAAAQITSAMTKSVATPAEDVLFIEYSENILGDMAVSRLYALPARYGKNFDDEDIDILDILNQAMDDLGGELEPVHQTTRLITRHGDPTAFHISGWLTENEAVV